MPGLILEVGLQDSLATALRDYIDAGTAPELVFETSADGPVATIVLDGANAFGTPTAGVISMTNPPKSDTNAVGGTVAQFSIFQNAAQGAAKVLEGVVGTSGEDINLSSLVVGASDTVELTTFTLTIPAS